MSFSVSKCGISYLEYGWQVSYRQLPYILFKNLENTSNLVYVGSFSPIMAVVVDGQKRGVSFLKSSK